MYAVINGIITDSAKQELAPYLDYILCSIYSLLRSENLMYKIVLAKNMNLDITC